MADTEDDTTTAPPPAPTVPLTPDMLARAMQIAQQLTPQPVQMDTTPVKQSWLSLLGEALGGGKSIPMSPADEQRAGLRSLGDFGTSLMAASHYQPGQTAFSNLAQGFEGAQRGMLGSEQMAASYLGAQQDWQQKQQAMRIAALKEALPLLTLQARTNMPSLYGGGQGAPGASGGGGGAPGGIQFTGDPAKDLPAVKAHESSGDYGAMNYVAKADPTAWDRGATATGAYQMVQSTWDAGKRLAGIDPGQYPRAMDAPPDVQDKVAAAVYAKHGSAPWDPSTWKSNWVQGPGGKYSLQANAPYTGPLPKAPPGAAPSSLFIGGTKTAPAATPTASPAPALPVPPIPPSVPPGATKAPATPSPAAAGVVSPGELPGAGQGAALPPGPVQPPVVPAPQVTTQQPTPTPTPAVTTPPPPPGPLSKNPDGTFTVPDEKLSVPQYQARWRQPPTPEELTSRGIIIPGNEQAFQNAQAGVAEAEREAAAAHTTADSIMRTGIGGTDASRAIQAANDADKNAQDARDKYAAMLQDTTKTNATSLQKFYTDQDAQLASAHQQLLDRQQQTAEAEKTRQADLLKTKIGAGYTAEQHQVDAEQTAGNDQLKTMGEAAQKAEAIQPLLRQLIPLLSDPKAPSGTFGQFLSNHQEYLPILTSLGLDPKTASITQLVNGLTNYLTLDLKPTATGAMRIQELPMLKGLMPSLATDTPTQQQALARVLNYTQRVKDEYDFASEHFGDAKTGPDGQPVMMSSGIARPNYRIAYQNIDAPMQLDENGRRTGGGLGSVVPTPPQLSSNPTASEVKAMTSYNRYVQNLAPGMPYNIYEQQPDGSLQLKMKIHN